MLTAVGYDEHGDLLFERARIFDVRHTNLECTSGVYLSI
jgi:hypothetical protein